MNYEALKIFTTLLPKELIDAAINLNQINVDEYSWKYDHAILVIEILTKNDICTLGGDVYKLIKDKVSLTNDSWYYQYEKEKTISENAQKSKEISTLFLKQLVYNNDQDYIFSIII